MKEELRDVVYEVGDLLEVDNNGKPDFDSLIDALDGTIAPPLWDDVGGPGTIAAEAPSKIRVHQYPDVHVQIAQILQAIRDGRRLATASSQK